MQERIKKETELKENSEFHRSLRLIVCSETRRRLLLSLLEGDKSLHDLYSELGISAPGVLHSLGDLRGCNYVCVDEKRYALTFIGRSFALKMIDFGKMAAVLKKHETFWLKHDTSGIPDHLLGMILLLSDCTMLASSQTHILEAYRRGWALLEGAKAFKLVSATGVPEADKFLNKLASDQIPMHLVLAEDVLRHNLKHAHLVDVQRTLGKRCTLSVLRHDPKLTIVVTDSMMVLALPHAREFIDFSNVLFGQSREATKWGTVLFLHYAEAAERVSLAEFA